jgi:o-succinylbenzoate synthase
MLVVQEIALREIRLPLVEPFRISSGVMAERRILLLELRHPDGAVAWAECVAFQEPIYSPETIDTAWLAIREWVAPRVLGRAFDGPEQVFDVLEKDFRGHPMAKAAVEMGMWALTAELQGIALSKLLVGERGRPRDRVPTGISLGIQSRPELLVARAQRAVADGYRKIKVKIMPGADVPFVKAVREALGADVQLMADANSAYSISRPEHLVSLAALDAFDLIMLEQPLGRDDLVRHATLQRQLRTPICLDESITDLERCEDMLKLGSGRIVNIKPGRVGGFASSLAIHDLCARSNVPVWCGGMLESGIGRAHNVALASLPNFSLPGDLSPSARYWAQDVVTPEWTMDADGLVPVPLDRPGLGVDVNVDRIDDLTVRREVLGGRPTLAVV